jgi:hypothetical protein
MTDTPANAPAEPMGEVERAYERLTRFCSHSGLYDAQQVSAGHDLTFGNLRAILSAPHRGLVEALRPFQPYHGKTNSFGKAQALRASVKLLRERYEQRKCDDEGVAGCSRCSIMFLVNTVEQTLDKALATPAGEGGDEVELRAKLLAEFETRAPEPYEYMTKDDFKALSKTMQGFISAYRNWRDRNRAALSLSDDGGRK